jgi:hypothetical protein
VVRYDDKIVLILMSLTIGIIDRRVTVSVIVQNSKDFVGLLSSEQTKYEYSEANMADVD